MAEGVTKVTGGSWVRTRLCGCGECQHKPGPCPQENSVNAIWLWGSEYTAGDDMPVVEDVDSWDEQ